MRGTDRTPAAVAAVRGAGSTGSGSGQDGDIIVSWLVKIVLLVAVVGLIAYELLSIAVTTVALDDNAREVARAARDAYRAEQSLEQAEQSAQEVADLHGAEIVEIGEEDGELTVTLEKQAPTLLVDRIDPLERFTVRTHTTSIRIQP